MDFWDFSSRKESEWKLSQIILSHDSTPTLNPFSIKDSIHKLSVLMRSVSWFSMFLNMLLHSCFNLFLNPGAVSLLNHGLFKLLDQGLIYLTLEPWINLVFEPWINLAPEPWINITPEPWINLAPEPWINVALKSIS